MLFDDQYFKKTQYVMIYLFRYLISVMLHTVSIIFNAGICFDRLGDTFFTWQRSRFGKELECITNINNNNDDNNNHHHLQLENSQELILTFIRVSWSQKEQPAFLINYDSIYKRNSLTLWKLTYFCFLAEI